MWCSDVQFDGVGISATLVNQPNWVRSVKNGDRVRLRLDEISDWMYTIQDEVFGGYTVNVMREDMNPKERAEHDGAWGLNFGDPKQIRIVHCPEGQTEDDVMLGDHPMALNMGSSFADFLKSDPSQVNMKDDNGFTFLHHQSLAGSMTCAKILIDHGADRTIKTPHGHSAADLAEILGWADVATLVR